MMRASSKWIFHRNQVDEVNLRQTAARNLLYANARLRTWRT